MNETGWLIEAYDHFPRHRWLRVIAYDRNASISWTEDASEAIRFSRERDAAAFAMLHAEHCTLAKITEHSWCSPLEATET